MSNEFEWNGYVYNKRDKNFIEKFKRKKKEYIERIQRWIPSESKRRIILTIIKILVPVIINLWMILALRYFI